MKKKTFSEYVVMLSIFGVIFLLGFAAGRPNNINELINDNEFKRNLIFEQSKLDSLQEKIIDDFMNQDVNYFLDVYAERDNYQEYAHQREVVDSIYSSEE